MATASSLRHNAQTSGLAIQTHGDKEPFLSHRAILRYIQLEARKRRGDLPVPTRIKPQEDQGEA